MNDHSISMNVHLAHNPKARIDCDTQTCASSPDGYPVLHIGPVAFFPNHDQLVKLRDVIGAYLVDSRAAVVQGESTF